MDLTEIREIDAELQRLAFNLADALDSLNCHSLGEAVAYLKENVFSLAAPLRALLRRLLRQPDAWSALCPRPETRDAIETELSSMDALLEVLIKCTGEARNYHELMNNMIPLLRLCAAWGECGPLAARGLV